MRFIVSRSGRWSTIDSKAAKRFSMTFSEKTCGSFVISAVWERGNLRAEKAEASKKLFSSDSGRLSASPDSSLGKSSRSTKYSRKQSYSPCSRCFRAPAASGTSWGDLSSPRAPLRPDRPSVRACLPSACPLAAHTRAPTAHPWQARSESGSEPCQRVRAPDRGCRKRSLASSETTRRSKKKRCPVQYSTLGGEDFTGTPAWIGTMRERFVSIEIL